MLEIVPPERPQPNAAPSIAPPMAGVGPVRPEIVAPKAEYVESENFAVEPVPASSSGSSGGSDPLDNVAESSPDKLMRGELEGKA